MENAILLKGNRPKNLTNADLYGVDTVIFDLSDTVLDEDKNIARLLLKEAFLFLDYSKINTFIKVNLIETKEGIEDIMCFKVKVPNAFIITINSNAILLKVKTIIDDLESLADISQGHIQMIVAIENMEGFEQIKDFIEEDKRICGVFLDTEKVLKSLNPEEDKWQEMTSYLKNKLENICIVNGLLFIEAKEVACY